MERGRRLMPRRLPGWLRPAPGSVVADALRRGRSPWVDAVHVLVGELLEAVLGEREHVF